MALVTAARLNDYMNSPHWDEKQTTEAGEICQQVEERLASRLDSPLSAGPPLTETVAVLATGLVATTYPIFTMMAIDDTTIADDDPLPSGWIIRDNRLRATTLTIPGPLAMGNLAPSLGMSGRVDGVGSVTVTYLPGWGPKPALINAILDKAKAIMTNRHDDTVSIRDLDATPPPPEKEDWSDDEINNTLGIYRNLTVFR